MSACVLAFDTSADHGSVVLGNRERVLARCALPARRARSESLLPAVRDLLDRTGVTLDDVEAIAVGSGPGSFTGLRIGAALAKGLCFARGLPLYAYSSLSAIVAGLPIEGRICAMIDARGGRVFAATYAAATPLHELAPPAVWDVRELIAELDPLSSWTLAGDGAARHAQPIRAAGGRPLSESNSRPRAEGLLHLVREQPEGRVEDVRSWQPEYLLPPAAERLVAFRVPDRSGSS